ncbi:MAG: L,D-transpeptidase family protein [Amaricoccus sp.]
MHFRPLSLLASTALACGLATAAAADPTDGPMAASDAAAGAAVAAAPALTPAQAAFRDDLAAALAGVPQAQATAIGGFYAARDYAPFWAEPGSDRPAALAAALVAAPAQALPLRSDDIEALTRVFGPTAAPAGDAEREVAATRAYLGLADDMAAGVLAPGSLYPDIQVRPSHPAPAALMALLDKAPLPDVLAGLQPADPDYARLVAEKARLEALDAGASWGPDVPDGPTMHPGDADPRVSALRARLARLGYLVPDGETAGSDFDPTLQDAVEAFQADYGLNADGVVGSLTLDAINAPTETRLAQVAVNLERLRWLNRSPEPRYLFVNIPDFTVRLIEDGKTSWESKVVVGKTHVTETPEFSGVVKYMVVNPTWHIPDSIAIRDYLPKLQKDPLVLQRQNIRLLTRAGTEIDPSLVDFSQYTPESFPFRIKQRPSDDNALGKVKFLFPNQNSVYMHDTPHRDLFARDVRAFSNGCIRLQKPVELADIVLQGQVPDPQATFDALLATGKEKTVTLERTIPVHIDYRTVWFDDAGSVHYRPDVYGRDAKVFDALVAAGVALPAAQG